MKKIINNRFFQLCLVLVAGFLLGWLIFKPTTTFNAEHVHEHGKETTYTCSMHPQIRQNEPGKCPICGMDLIPLTQKSAQGESNPFVYTMSPEAIALANVQTQKVQYVSPEHEVNMTGKIAINEQLMAVITANYSGRIEKLFVDYTGQAVSKGQKLATIYSPELVTAQKELIEAAKFKENNPSLYQASKEKLRLWKINESQISEIENSGRVMTEFDVYADRSGIVIRRDITTGDYANKGTVLFGMADLSKVWVLLDAYESDLAFIKTGQQINITVPSIPGKVFSSTVNFIDPIINPQTRTASVRAELNNPQQILKPEMFVRAVLKTRLSVNDKSLAIPKTSILWTGKRSVVYVRVPDVESPSFEMREITLGNSLGDFYLVVNGLMEGEEIVTNGVFAIDAAAQLSGNYSMMNRVVDNRIVVPEKFTDQLTNFVNDYFVLKNNLIKSDFQLSNISAKKLASALSKVDMKLLTEDAHNTWMKHDQVLKKQIELFVKANDLEKQREVFSTLSNQLIETSNLFSLNYETVYVAHCPMAFDDKGANWLSEFEEIKNPYFGDAMLRCGEVKSKINKNVINKQHSNEPSGHKH